MVDKCPNCGSDFFFNTAGQYCSVCGYNKPLPTSYLRTTTETDKNISISNHIDTPNILLEHINNRLQTLTIDCNKIILHHKSLDIDIDISANIDSFDEITVNGIRFRKEVEE